MEIIPAIDLMDGSVVRLTKGDPKTVKSYQHFGDPLTVARRWENEGADKIHIIDLDRALNRGNNIDVINKIVFAINTPIQVGGGIRRIEFAQKLLGMGVDRIILGTLAFNEANSVIKLLKAFGDKRVVIALDYLDEEVMIRGWKTQTRLGIEEALTQFLGLKAKLFLATAIERDGTLTGPDYKTLSKACNFPGIEIIAAGGISSLEDLITLKQIGVQGVVIGKALYEGRFELREAVKKVKRDDLD